MACDPTETRVTLAIQRGGETINGTLADERGASRSFWGWLELIAALDALRDKGVAGDPACNVTP